MLHMRNRSPSAAAAPPDRPIAAQSSHSPVPHTGVPTAPRAASCLTTVGRFAGQAAAVALILSAIAAPAWSQAGPPPADARPAANQANWSLAERFSSAALRPVLYTNGVQPHWLGETDSLWYNWRDHDGSRFFLVVPATHTKEPLFDRQKLAAELTETSLHPIDPNNLPFTTITFLKNHKAFRFTVDSTRYEWNLASQTLKSLGKPPKRDSIPPDEEREEQRGGRGRGGFGGGGNRDFHNYSPDSTAFVFAREHNLYVVEVGKPDTIQVTTDGVEDYSFGARDTSENRRQLNALSQRRGGGDEGDTGDDDAESRDMRVRANAIWSPDSKSFAIVRRDQRKVGELYLVNDLAQPRPVLIHYKYAMPGEVNVPQSELWVYQRGEKSAKQLDVKKWKDQQLSDLHWPLNGDKLRLVRRDRLQRDLDLIEVDVNTNAIKTLLSESIEHASIDPQPVEYTKKGGDMLWWSERSGWAQYYVYDFNGGTAPKYPLTQGAWHADDIAQIDSTRGIIWFTAEGREPGENPYYQHLYRVNANGSGLTLLDPGDFTHNESLSPTKRYFVDNFSRVNAPTKSVLRDAATGHIVMDLEETDVSGLEKLGWKPPEPFVVKAADGVTDIYGNMWKPFDFDSTKLYPIIANVYPGPQTESVTFPFSPSNTPQQLAQLGFIVIQIGNRGGSPQRSLAYHRYGYYNLRDYALADKKAGIEQLAAAHPWIDLDRVGIYGHSGGGFLTAAAMLLPPYNDFFKVGVSESGNHDNNIYNQNWSEWNHGLKVVPLHDSTVARGRRRGGRVAGGPAEGSAIPDSILSAQDSVKFQIHVPTNEELAKNLKGNLLLETGGLDNNVHPGNTIRLVNALIKADKRFDFMILPGQPHGYRDMVGYTNHLMMEYFAEHLLGDYYRTNAEIQ